MRRHVVVVLVGMGLGIAALLHPPWTATAVLARMDYTGFPAVPPRMVNDTATWRVPFAAVYRPPSLDMEPSEVAGYQRRLSSGDKSAAAEWRRGMESIETSYRVPAKLRSAWIGDSVTGSPSGVAYRRSIVSSYFEIDRARLAFHLFAIGIVTLVALIATNRLKPE